MTLLTPEILIQHNIIKGFKDGFHTLQIKVGGKYFTYWSKNEVKHIEEWQEILLKHTNKFFYG